MWQQFLNWLSRLAEAMDGIDASSSEHAAVEISALRERVERLEAARDRTL